MAETSEILEASFSSEFPFVEVVGPDGKKKRFAKGTRAGFAVERFNKLLPNDQMPVVCIQAFKEGEEAIEFGPDVELILYDKAWILQSVSEEILVPSITVLEAEKIDSKMEADTEVLQTETATEEIFTWSDSSKAPWVINEGFVAGRKGTSSSEIDSMKKWEEFYPGGKLPVGGKQDCTPEYLAKVLMIFILIFAFAAGLSFMLERMPELPKSAFVQPS